MAERDLCVACRKTLGHRPRDCQGSLCACRCRTEDVPLDVTGFYWSYRYLRPRRPLPVFTQYGSMLLEVDQAEARRRAAVAEQGQPTQRERRAARRREPLMKPVAPTPPATVLTRREQLIADELAQMRAKR